MTTSLLSLLWFALLIGLCYGVGRFVVKNRFPDFLERFLFAVPIGMGIVGFALFALGLAKLYYTLVFYGVLALGLPGWFFLVSDLTPRRGAPTPSPYGRGGNSRDLLDLCIYGVLGVLAFCTLIGALAPPNGYEWDALSYHLTVPKTYLREHRMFYIPYDHHSNFPFLIQMLYTLMLGVGSIGGAKLCHWLCGVLLVVSVLTFAKRMHRGDTGKRIGQVAALLIAGSPIVFWEATVAYVDLATALFTWLSFYALLVYGKQKESGLLTLSALMMGLAIGTKWTVLGFWGILLAGFAVYNIARERRITATLIKQLVVWGGISFALALPWLLRSYLYAGSPVYPYYYNIFGGNYWNAENAAQYAHDQATLGLGKDPIFLLLTPWLINIFPVAREYNEYGFAFSLALVPLLLAAPFKRTKWNRVAVAIAAFSLVGYVFCFFLVQQTRYFMPLLPGIALLAAEALISLWTAGKGFARYVGAALVAVSALFGAWMCVNFLTTPAIRVVLGTESTADYIKNTATSGVDMSGLYPAYDWINTNTPPNAKVAIFDDTFGFYIDRPILWATPNHAYNLIPWDSYNTVDDWLADFKRRGYTTLLVNEANAPRADSPLANEKWRLFLQEAIATGKVESAFESPNSRGRFVRVYRIP